MEAYKAWDVARNEGDKDYAIKSEMVRLALHLIESLMTAQHAAVVSDAKHLVQLTNEFYTPETDNE